MFSKLRSIGTHAESAWGGIKNLFRHGKPSGTGMFTHAAEGTKGAVEIDYSKLSYEELKNMYDKILHRPRAKDLSTANKEYAELQNVYDAMMKAESPQHKYEQLFNTPGAYLNPRNSKLTNYEPHEGYARLYVTNHHGVKETDILMDAVGGDAKIPYTYVTQQLETGETRYREYLEGFKRFDSQI